MKRCAIIAAFLLIVFGGGYTKKEGFSASSAQASTSEKAEPGANTTVFIELNPMTLPIIDERGLSQTVTLVVTIEASNEESGEKVKHLAPRLTDAYIQDMYGVLSRKTSMETGILKVSVIKERLNKVSRQVLGDDGYTDVLLQVVNQRSFY